jgi:hypothetical protein
MSTGPLSPSVLPSQNSELRLQSASPRSSRVAGLIFLFVLATLSILAGRAVLLRPIFPAMSLLVGSFLYRHDERYFLSFFLWIMMLAPILRRLVDWRSSYQEQSMILLAPLLLSLLPVLDLRSRLQAATSQVRNTAFLTFAGILFGTGVGLIKHPDAGVLLAALT